MYFSLVLFSNILFFFSLFWGSFLGFWLSLELAMLLLIPCFFYYNSNNNVYLSLLNYVIIASLSSCLLISGLLVGLNEWFLLASFIIKVGLFPFYNWFFYLINNLNWFMIFSLAVVSKIVFFYFLNFSFSSNILNFVLLYFTVNFLVLSLLISYMVFDIKSFYIFSSISSSILFLYLLFFGSSLSLYTLYAVYFIISCFVLISFYFFCFNHVNIVSLCLVLGVPFSLYIFYKGFSILFLLPFNNYLFILFWILYSILEQIILFNILLEAFYLKISV
uniref:NADH dehydrogenase subunit 2 n=1 Tax=Thaparocleidus varicus TaxID=341076 RepID=A0A7L8ZQT3_9PLAT|nr:NADH dehydrogenase subunit 2 [Thaparocleidus varicus]QOI72765.1 NADH dehydrogenase subunit 2 [Thaparocleidus varicus]